MRNICALFFFGSTMSALYEATCNPHCAEAPLPVRGEPCYLYVTEAFHSNDVGDRLEALAMSARSLHLLAIHSGTQVTVARSECNLVAPSPLGQASARLCTYIWSSRASLLCRTRPPTAHSQQLAVGTSSDQLRMEATLGIRGRIPSPERRLRCPTQPFPGSCTESQPRSPTGSPETPCVDEARCAAAFEQTPASSPSFCQCKASRCS